MKSGDSRTLVIDTAACGVSKRLIAARHKISFQAVFRHAAAHLTPEVRAALATKILQREGDMRRVLLEEGTSIVEALKAIRGPLFGLYLAAVDSRLKPSSPLGGLLTDPGSGDTSRRVGATRPCDSVGGSSAMATADDAVIGGLGSP